MKNEDLERVVFAQGWIGNQTTNLVPKDEHETVLFGQWQEMWKALDEGIDKLVKENLRLQELEQKLQAIKNLAGRNALEEKLEGISNILDT